MSQQSTPAKQLAKAAEAAKHLAAEAAEATPQLPKGSVMIGKKKYKFRFPKFYFDGALILAEDAAMNAELLGKIVAVEGQNVLVEQS